jgi:ABC-type branched-subunit amino acid transport system ATPase component
MNNRACSAKIIDNLTQLSNSPENEAHLIICPSKNNWNDFGYRLIVDVYIALPERHIKLGTGKLLIADQNTTSNFIREQKLSSPTEINTALGSRPFLFTLTDPESYKKIKNLVDSNTAKKLLLATHDWGAIINFDKDSPSLEKLKNSEGLIKGLLRDDSTFNAGIDLKSILSEDDFFSNIVGLTVRCDIPMPYGKLLALSLDYTKTPFGLSRINVLIGENGVGKTEILRFLSQTDNKTSDFIQVSKNEPAALTNERKLFKPTTIAANQKLEIFSEIVFIESFLDDIEALKPKANNRSLTSILLQTLRNPDSEWEVLERAMSSYVSMEELYLPVIIPENSKMTTIETSEGPYANIRENRWGEERSLEFFNSLDTRKDPAFFKSDGTKIRLSSGQRSFFRYSLTLMQSGPKNSLFLIDEPELTLHPQMIAALMRITDAILQSKQSFAVIATHSLHVIREIHKEAVHVITRDKEGVPHDMSPYLQTFGSDLSELSAVVFPEEKIEELFEKKVIQTAGELFRKNVDLDDSEISPTTKTYEPNIEKNKLEVRRQLAGYLGPVGSNFLRDTLETLEKDNAKN